MNMFLGGDQRDRDSATAYRKSAVNLMISLSLSLSQLNLLYWLDKKTRLYGQSTPKIGSK